MSKRNKKRRHEDLLSPIITVLKDGFLGGLLLIAISHGVHVFSQSREADYNARQSVISQFVVSKNVLSEYINICLKGAVIPRNVHQKMLDERKKLVQLAVVDKPLIPSDLYLKVIQYTRFFDARKIQTLCSLDAEKLNSLQDQVTDLEVKLRKSP